MSFKTIFFGKETVSRVQMSNSYLFRHGLPLHDENKIKTPENSEFGGRFIKLEKKAEGVVLSKDTVLRKVQKFLYKTTGWSLFLSGSAAAMGGEPDAYLAAGAGAAIIAAVARLSEWAINLFSGRKKQ